MTKLLYLPVLVILTAGNLSKVKWHEITQTWQTSLLTKPANRNHNTQESQSANPETEEPTQNETLCKLKCSRQRKIANYVTSIASLYWPYTANQSVLGVIVPYMASQTWSTLRSMSSRAVSFKTLSAYINQNCSTYWVLSRNWSIMARLTNWVAWWICYWPICRTHNHCWCCIELIIPSSALAEFQQL